MKKSYKFLTAFTAVIAIASLASGAFAGGPLKNERLLGNNEEGVDQYRLIQEKNDRTQRHSRMHPANIQPAAGGEGTDLFSNENALGNNPDGSTSYSAGQQKLQWQYMKQHHPATIEPAGGGHGNVASQGTYNRFTDDPFGDIED